MGTTFDCFDDRAHGDATASRRQLRQAMTKQGFVPYAKEWWHFTLAAEPYPDTTFDMEISRP